MIVVRHRYLARGFGSPRGFPEEREDGLDAVGFSRGKFVLYGVDVIGPAVRRTDAVDVEPAILIE
jgi:hypothetical protein